MIIQIYRFWVPLILNLAIAPAEFCQLFQQSHCRCVGGGVGQIQGTQIQGTQTIVCLSHVLFCIGQSHQPFYWRLLSSIPSGLETVRCLCTCLCTCTCIMHIYKCMYIDTSQSRAQTESKRGALALSSCPHPMMGRLVYNLPSTSSDYTESYSSWTRYFTLVRQLE